MPAPNENTIDRGIRAVLGVILVYAGLWPMAGLQGNLAGILVTVAGLVLVVTAATGFCLLYRVFGISTCKK
jgi:uncharacterized membrane protein